MNDILTEIAPLGPALHDPRAAAVAARKTPASVLVVDVDPGVRELIKRWLTLQGHHCAVADGAEAAWEYLAKHEVHLVTLDINMTGRSGIQLLTEITDRYRDTGVIIMTGLDDTQAAIDTLTRGASGYLLKPVKREEVLFHVGKALERRHLIIEKRRHTLQLEEKVRQQTAVIRRTQEEIIQRLVTASLWRDEETGDHIRRVGLLSEALAKAADWTPQEAEDIRMAAPMHDVGKIGIPDAILRKPGKLTPEEFETMKAHTTIGARMLEGSDTPILRMAAEIAQNHHERWDGAGYPNNLVGNAIPESARIVAIVDVYDALSHARVYRPRFSDEMVYKTLQQGAGSHFDPLLLALFFSHLEEMREIAMRNPEASGTPAQGPLSW